MMQAWGWQVLTGPTMQGSDRWQPPDIPNADEVLMRPERVEENAEQDQEAPERAINQTEATPAFAAAADDDAVATSVDDTEVQQDVAAQEETRREQHRPRQRSDSLYLYRL